MNVLVTEAEELVGSRVADRLSHLGGVFDVDDLSAGYRASGAGVDCELIEGSILDMKAPHEIAWMRTRDN